MRNDRNFSIERPLKKGKRSIDIGITPHPNGIIIVNCAGGLEDLDGRDNRYKQIAKFVQRNEVGTFVRVGNDLPNNLSWPESALDDFRYLVDYCKKNGKRLSGEINPRIFLMGYSAGAGIATIVGSEFSVEKMLLIAPGIDCGRRKIKKSLEAFTGDVYITIGENDCEVGYSSDNKAGKYVGNEFYSWAVNSKRRELEVIPNCTHGFEGEINSKILSKAPLWAFADDKTFPNPEGGITMYDKGKGHFVRTSYILDNKTGKLVRIPN